jgi:putative NADH-flavin reductase
MKVAVIGATGNAGSRITAELLKRGHHVRAIVRPQTNVHLKNGLEVANSDLSDVAQLTAVSNWRHVSIAAANCLSSRVIASSQNS